MDGKSLQNSLRRLYAGLRSCTNQFTYCYDVGHVSTYSGNLQILTLFSRVCGCVLWLSGYILTPKTLCTRVSVCFPSTVRMNPISSFELLFFAVFGQTTTEQTQTDKILNLQIKTQPYWTEYLFKIVFGIYMLVSVVVLINLLIAMMSDTYQRIQVLGCCL